MEKRRFHLKTLWFVTLFLFVASSIIYANDTKRDTNTGKKIDLKVLYAGHPRSQRERDYYNFLTEHFVTVEKSDFKTFTPENAEDYDVVILDYDGDGFRSPIIDLDRSYTRPTITVGVTGALLSGSKKLRLKTRYM